MNIKRLGSLSVMIIVTWLGVQNTAFSQLRILSPRDRLLRYNECPRCDLIRTDLSYLDLRGADLRGADLRQADLSYSDLSYSDLRGADLRGAITEGTIFNFIRR
ncbi:pentapeptide repeat-containing protein [Leptolyngbya sp. Heron Island J]|uniref:pentapeptide repeat-containing protein n=1 Tax=Leptolyngbya sp. Heron Island J TaxID=1385935 RepID=UPI00190F1F11|nr:pentapeptide repeat-containing protein [Leptolyngbya sp. Heron Island J]